MNIRPGHKFLILLGMSTTNGVLVDFVENAAVIDTVRVERSAHLSTSHDHGMVYCEHSWQLV